MTELLPAALDYAAGGFPVLALHSPADGACSCRRPDCASPAKHPRTAHGLADATTDAATIERWWGLWPDANVGVAVPAGYVLADFDVPEVNTVIGARPLPGTACAQTGRGYHFLYRTSSDVRPRVGLLPHLDLRGPGSYFVAPPSRHVNGTEYVWLVSPDEEVALAPDWLVESAPRSRATPTPGEPIEEGSRNDTLARLGGAMRHQGMTVEEIAAGLLAVNAGRVRPPLPTAEVEAIATSVGRYAPGEHGPRLLIPKGTQAVESRGIDAADLLALELPPLRVIVPDLLVEGTTVLASPPKVGKSCLVYQMAVEVSVGGTLLGRRVESGSALYLALEDGERRGRARLAAALGGRTMPRGRLEVRWGARRIGAGLEDDLEAWLDDHADAVLVAVDTLQRARQPTTGRRNAYEVDVEDLGRLQGLFRDRRVALVVVHHSRKDTADDFLASVGGTYGITGSVDSIIVIRRKRLEQFGTVVATGRDIPEAEVSARFDGMLWHEAPAVLSQASFERIEVYRVIEESGPIFPAAIADQIGLERTSVQHMVQALCEKGAVARTAKGYIVPDIELVAGDALTRARTGNPGHSTHSDSEQSEGGHPRTRAREAGLLTNGAPAGAAAFEGYLDESRGGMWDKLDEQQARKVGP